MYRRRRGYNSFKRASKKVRYSNETSCVAIDSGYTGMGTMPIIDNKVGAILVAATDLQGTRKCKNFTLSLTSQGNTVPLICALIYCPGGLQPNNLGAPNPDARAGVSLYEPNQNVIMQFVMNPVLDTNAGSDVQVFRTRLARNLDSGDYIALIFTPARAPSAQETVHIRGTLNYAISY